MAQVALVLGGGGVVGAAFHTGVLGALADATGWDPHTADLVVGTSAGALVAAGLRGGLDPAELRARADAGPGTPLPPLDLDPRRLLRPAAPWLTLAAVVRRGAPRPGLLAAGWLPRGRVPTAAIGERLRELHPEPWPAAPTWITAVRLHDGRRVTFGRDDVDPGDLGAAVEASCAVPGYFRPVRIGGADHVDGGAWSVTNADLVARCGFDLVVVVAPLAAGRTLHAWRLDREVAAIEASGTPVFQVRPDGAAARAMGGNPMDAGKVPAVVARAEAVVDGLVADPAHAGAVARLAGQPTRSRDAQAP